MTTFLRGQQVGTKIFPLGGRTLYERATLIRPAKDIHVPGYWHVRFAHDGGRLCVHESSMVDWTDVSPGDDYHGRTARHKEGEMTQNRIIVTDDFNGAADRVARAFSEMLRNDLGDQTMQEIIRLNATEAGTGICHSHDFCDANVTMGEAVAEELGVDDLDPDDEDQANLWNAAWDIAVRAQFFIPKAAKENQ